MYISSDTKQNVINDLFASLVTFSNGKLNGDVAQRVAIAYVNSMDFTNSALLHKGTNWLAKEIIKSMQFK